MLAPETEVTEDDFERAEEQASQAIGSYLVRHLGYDWTADGNIRRQLPPRADTFLTDADMDAILHNGDPQEALNDYIDMEVALPLKERFANETFQKDYRTAFVQLPSGLQDHLVQSAKDLSGEQLPLRKLSTRFMDSSGLMLATDEIRNRLLFQPTKLSIQLTDKLARPSRCKDFLLDIASQQGIGDIVEKSFRQYEWRGSRHHLPNEGLPYVDAYSKLIRMRKPRIAIQSKTEFHYALALADKMEQPVPKNNVAVFSVHGNLAAFDPASARGCQIALPESIILPIGDVVSIDASPLLGVRVVKEPAIAFMDVSAGEWKQAQQRSTKATLPR